MTTLDGQPLQTAAEIVEIYAALPPNIAESTSAPKAPKVPNARFLKRLR